MSNNYFVDEVQSPVTVLTYLALALFTGFTIGSWVPDYSVASIEVFRYLAAAIACFMAGTLWGSAFLLKLDNETFEFHRAGVIWGALLVVLGSAGVLLLEAKVGLFVAALLFLVLWQVENKTNLARLYPEWYWVLRTKATMVVALCHILIWITQG